MPPQCVYYDFQIQFPQSSALGEGQQTARGMQHTRPEDFGKTMLRQEVLEFRVPNAQSVYRFVQGQWFPPPYSHLRRVFAAVCGALHSDREYATRGGTKAALISQ